MIATLTVALGASGTVIPSFTHGDDCVRHNRLFCWHWFTSHWSDMFGPALVQHLLLTVIAVAVGFVISLSLALAAYRKHWLEQPVSIVTGLLYTIPSLALFQILVPFTGLHRLTVEIALVSYTLLILFRNILIGLREVPDEVRESARGMGLSPSQSLLRVELPLALPAMIAGLRIATVTVISLATVAAFVIDEGLGGPIVKAIQAPFNTQFIGAGLLAVLLALTADALLVGARRLLTPWTSVRRA